VKQGKSNRTQMTQIEQINAVKISDDLPNQSNLSSIPKHWSWVKLGDVCEQVNKVKDFNKDGSFYYLDIGGINNKKNLIESVKEYEWRTAPSRAKQIVRSGDVLFSTVRTYLKNIAKVPLLYDNQIASTGFCIIRPQRNLLNTEYIFYLTLYDKFLAPLNALQVGSSYPAVRNGEVLKQVIPLPPLPEQKKIVEKIEELFSGLDSGVASLQKAKEQLRIYRQSVLAYAFSGKLTGAVKGETKNGELPEGWEWVKLNEVLEVKDGTHDTPKYKGKGIPFITQKNIKNGEFVFDGYNLISKEDHQKFYKRSNVTFNDIIISMIGANRGMSTIVKTKEVFSIKNVGLVKTEEGKLLSKFLDYFFKSEVGQKSILSKSKGGAQQFIGLTELRNWLVPLIPITMQTQIVEEIESRFAGSEALEKAIDDSLIKAELLRQSILKQAFEGKLI